MSRPVEVLHREGYRRKVLVPLGGVDHVLTYDEARELARDLLVATGEIDGAEARDRMREITKGKAP